LVDEFNSLAALAIACPSWKCLAIPPVLTHQLRIVTERLQPAAQVMRANTGFHADQHGGSAASRAAIYSRRDHFCRGVIAWIEADDVESISCQYRCPQCNRRDRVEHGIPLAQAAPLAITAYP